ncbi:MAG: hypothetical protein IIA67_07660 [Planctomycetes bacterium]|nr:hypothetical protein [Planctomycetota bacterium]
MPRRRGCDFDLLAFDRSAWLGGFRRPLSAIFVPLSWPSPDIMPKVINNTRSKPPPPRMAIRGVFEDLLRVAGREVGLRGEEALAAVLPERDPAERFVAAPVKLSTAASPAGIPWAGSDAVGGMSRGGTERSTSSNGTPTTGVGVGGEGGGSPGAVCSVSSFDRSSFSYSARLSALSRQTLAAESSVSISCERAERGPF